MPSLKIHNFYEDALYYTGTETVDISGRDRDLFISRIYHYAEAWSQIFGGPKKAKYTSYIFCPNDLEHMSIAFVHAETMCVCDKLIRYIDENSPCPEIGNFAEFIVPEWEGDYPRLMDRAEDGDEFAKKQLVRLKDCVV